MLEILPAIDLRDGKCVRLRQGDYNQETIFGDDPASMAERWASQGATRLHLVDLDGAKTGKPENLQAVRGILESVNIPTQLGGGVRSEETIVALLDAGVGRVIIGTKALREPDWFAELASKYPQKLVLGLDARDGKVATEGWLETSETDAKELAQRFVGVPIGAVVYTNIANDGMMQGIDPDTLDDLEALADMGLPTIASGGVTTLQDIRNLAAIHARQPHLVGAITGRALYDGAFDVVEAIAATR